MRKFEAYLVDVFDDTPAKKYHVYHNHVWSVYSTTTSDIWL